MAGVLARSIKTTADFRIANNIQYMCKRFTIKEIQCSADVCSTIPACLQLRMSAGRIKFKVFVQTVETHNNCMCFYKHLFILDRTGSYRGSLRGQRLSSPQQKVR